MTNKKFYKKLMSQHIIRMSWRADAASIITN